MSAQEQALQQGATFPRRSGRTELRLVGLVLLEHLLMFQIFIPTDVTRMMVLD